MVQQQQQLLIAHSSENSFTSSVERRSLILKAVCTTANLLHIYFKLLMSDDKSRVDSCHKYSELQATYPYQMI